MQLLLIRTRPRHKQTDVQRSFRAFCWALSRSVSRSFIDKKKKKKKKSWRWLCCLHCLSAGLVRAGRTGRDGSEPAIGPGQTKHARRDSRRQRARGSEHSENPAEAATEKNGRDFLPRPARCSVCCFLLRGPESSQDLSFMPVCPESIQRPLRKRYASPGQNNGKELEIALGVRTSIALFAAQFATHAPSPRALLCLPRAGPCRRCRRRRRSCQPRT